MLLSQCAIGYLFCSHFTTSTTGNEQMHFTSIGKTRSQGIVRVVVVVVVVSVVVVVVVSVVVVVVVNIS